VSFYPLENPIGFGASDFITLAITCLLVAAAIVWKPWLQPVYARFAERTVWCMLTLAVLPVFLRLLLLPHHPVPSPDVYDEFSHLLVADTLRHFRLANPPHPFHRFFETFFVLQEPTYSSIYPLGQGIALAFGRMIFGNPWAGVVFFTVAFCSLSYWMLRAWTTPQWALAGGILAVIEFGPLNSWMNSYWGGSFAATGGCLVFGSLPRLKHSSQWRYGITLGVGLGMIVLTRPFESLFVFISVLLYLAPILKNRALWATVVTLVLIFGLIARQNQRVTGSWTTLPYSLSQFQYGVPASLTLQPDAVPHRDLTPQQAMEYKAQLAFRAGKETLQSYLLRLEYRVRFYRFFFLPPLLVALLFYFATLRERRFLWVFLTVILFVLGINVFPAFQFHYLAPITPLFILMAVIGLDRLSRIKTVGSEAAGVLIFLCILQFAFWYSMHLLDPREMSRDLRQYETWNGINHQNPERRVVINHQVATIPGKILIFVHYSSTHIFQEEWVYNQADIDNARIVWARDLGPDENEKLRAYYSDRQVYLLEPDFRPPRLHPY